MLRGILTLAVCAGVVSGCVSSGTEDSIAYYNCGETPLLAQAQRGERLTLTRDNEIYVLHRTPSDTGALFETEAGRSPAMQFHQQGQTATYSVDGQTYPDCRRAVWRNRQDVENYRAFGNEPGWFVDMTKQRVVVKRGYDGKTVAYARPAADMNRSGRRYVLADDVRVTIRHAPKKQPCRDTMSGQYYPDHVTLEFEGETFNGCGDTTPWVQSDLPPLIDTEWVVEDIDGGGIIDNSHMSVRMDGTGRVTGSSGCNRYSAPYRLNGANLRIDGPIIATQRGCKSEALQAQEYKFMDLLTSMRHAGFQHDGGLLLSNRDGQTILLRHRQEPSSVGH